MKSFKWPAALLIFVLAFALLAGGIIIRQRNFIYDPFLKRLNDIEPVKGAKLTNADGVNTIAVDLAYISDFAAVYTKIDEMAASAFGYGNYRIKISDNRDEKLEKAYSIAHLAFYEAHRRGNFTDMANYVKAVMESFNISEHNLTVDGDRIYFSANNGSHYLYEVIYRQLNQEREVSLYGA